MKERIYTFPLGISGISEAHAEAKLNEFIVIISKLKKEKIYPLHRKMTNIELANEFIKLLFPSNKQK